jgi:hypothetical protein
MVVMWYLHYLWIQNWKQSIFRNVCPNPLPKYTFEMDLGEYTNSNPHNLENLKAQSQPEFVGLS